MSERESFIHYEKNRRKGVVTWQSPHIQQTMSISFKDHLYLWCHNAGVYNQGIPGLSEKSFMAPAEAARTLGIDNILMVSYGGKPTPPFEPIQEQFSHFKRVIWSIIGDSASTYDNPEAYVDEVISLHKRHPNVTGGIMDDFFNPGRTFDLPAISKKMHDATLPLWVVLYQHQLTESGILEQLENCDVITFWTWKVRDLFEMEENLAMLHKRFPSKKLVAGLYLWNFGDETPLTVHHMQYQCEVALDYLKTGIIDDIIVLGSPLIGMNLPTIDWTRNWIQENSN